MSLRQSTQKGIKWHPGDLEFHCRRGEAKGQACARLEGDSRRVNGGFISILTLPLHTVNRIELN